ncbi:hypothetical protein EZV62_027544 [Acer yangbiense]|uniref:Reverse transcriptase zinc-binding domain-containing protein n=1 Tax=Acer yangbiense TaxID=1000413 RepID=A0A5C7GUH5_9ROSI|nr:hypothetical protein EZV62_027544 [Acer yangbiense]
MVRKLISPSSDWNVSLIRSSFSSEETKAILSLPFCSTQVEGLLLWHYDKRDIYSVKSGYKLGKLLQSQHLLSGSFDGGLKRRCTLCGIIVVLNACVQLATNQKDTKLIARPPTSIANTGRMILWAK